MLCAKRGSSRECERRRNLFYIFLSLSLWQFSLFMYVGAVQLLIVRDFAWSSDDVRLALCVRAAQRFYLFLPLETPDRPRRSLYLTNTCRLLTFIFFLVPS